MTTKDLIINNQNAKEELTKMTINKSNYYVTMTDKFMSGWGMAEGKINKLIFICEDRQQAEIVADNARRRSDQKYINITTSKPYYNPKRYLAQVKTIEDYPSWYQFRHF